MRGTVAIKSTKDILPWRLGEYITRTSGNYLSVLYAAVISQCYWDHKVVDSDFVVAERLPKRWEAGGLAYDEEGNYVSLTEKAENPQSFWQIIQERPQAVVYRREDEHYKPLIWTHEYELKIVELKLHSPPSIDLSGWAPALVDLYYASEREERARVDFQKRQIEQIGRNVENVVRASQVVEDQRTPQGVKTYARELLQQALDAQAKLNDKLGIGSLSIDTIE